MIDARIAADFERLKVRAAQQQGKAKRARAAAAHAPRTAWSVSLAGGVQGLWYSKGNCKGYS